MAGFRLRLMKMLVFKMATVSLRKYYRRAHDFLSAFQAAKLLLAQAPSLLEQQLHLGRKYPSIASIEDFCLPYRSEAANSSTLDLGCGANPRNPFGAHELFGVDIREDLELGIKSANLSVEPIPFGDNEFDYCTAFDFLEHIPRVLPSGCGTRFVFIELMNEIYRVLKPGGLFFHRTPVFPSKYCFQDPTHVNIMTEDTMPVYFCLPENAAANLGYGFNGQFELLSQSWIDCGGALVSALRALK